MDGRGNVVCGDKFGCGDLDLFEADTSHSLTDGLLQFEPVGHRPAEMLQPVHCARDSFQTVTQCPITRPPRSHSTNTCTTPALRPRLWPQRLTHGRQRSAQTSHSDVRPCGSGWAKISVITAKLSAPAARTPSALAGVRPPIATSGKGPMRRFHCVSRSRPCGAHFIAFNRVS